jgi:diadenosine tetraphosphate (Ap4A) HIT family hydrolase
MGYNKESHNDGEEKMSSLKTCRFCRIIKGDYVHKDIDQPFAANDSFVAIASIGALIQGWTLVIPKGHQLSMRNCYNRRDFSIFVRALLPRLYRGYGNLAAFEHGSNREGSITSCGTDHAHLHIVPMRESLFPSIVESGLSWVQCYTSEITSMAKESEYLYYCDLQDGTDWDNPRGYFHLLEHPISQYFRQLIANRNGNGDQYDYRRFPFFENAEKTQKTLVDTNAYVL